MDPVSIAIIVTVLSMGSFLVYLFKTEFERTKKYNSTSIINGTNKKIGNNNNKHVKSGGTNQTTKQVTSVVSGIGGVKQTTTTLLHEQQSLATNGNTATTQTGGSFTKQVSSAIISKTDGHIGISETIGHNNNNNPKFSNKNIKKRDEIKVQTLEMVSSREEAPIASEPSADELDSSILLGVFNPANNSTKHIKSQQSKKANQITHLQILEKKQQTKKRQNFENNQPVTNCSAEKLLSIIAVSNLSKDEAELAVECLLNKIESGAANWQQPKSDPLQKLKNQIRDSELALSIEVQNHEQTRVRLMELKSQLQNERSNNNLLKDEISKQRKEFENVNLALQQARCDLSKQQLLYKQLKDENSHVISKLEQDKIQLQSLLANSSGKEGELGKLRNELEEKMHQLQRYELSNQTMGEKIEELEHQVNNSRLLEKSVKELQLINGRQEEMLMRLRDERHVNDASMKRTLCEMEQELKELQTKLSANSASHDERLRKEMSQVEVELNNADQREQKLMSEIRELRDGLFALLPDDIKRVNELNCQKSENSNWVQQYLAAFRQLSKTVEELKETNNNNIESPSKKSVDKSTLTITTRANGNSSRVSSPLSFNGRSSRAGSHKEHHDGDKKLMETKLLELNDYATKLEEDVRKLEEENRGSSNSLPAANEQSHYQQQIKELKMQRIKLEAQVKFGLDSLKMEQERIRDLEEQLAKFNENTVKSTLI